MTGLVYGSVCSGIEAATVAWHPLGWRPSFFSEIEAAPRAVLQHRHPEVPLHGDFTTIREGEFDAIDLLVGGTPCQSFSVAGLRGGLADDRGNLALEYLRLAKRLRARWVVFENVPGLLSSNGGRDFGAFLGGLVELGYGFAYRVLDAQYVRVDGFGRAVPQRRRRIILVGHLGDWRRPAAVLFERSCLRGDPAPRREAGAGTAVGALAGTGPGGGWRIGPDEAAAGQLVAAPFAPAISASNPYGDHESREGLLVAHSLRGEGFDASEDGTGRGTPIVPVASTLLGGGHSTNSMEETLIAFQQGGSNVGTTGLISNTLTKGNGNEGGGVPCIAFNSRQDPDVTWDRSGALGSSSPQAEAIAFQERGRESGRSLEIGGDVAFALTAPSGGGRAQEKNILHGWAVRRLTPRECERLQGFPDDYTLVPWRGGLLPDGPRYKALGNSMAVNVMRWIGTRIAAVDGLALPSLQAAE
ncbi:DNA (cytosine-5)-methyltransferase 1 [Methylobacterium sp. RAS18]|nr:DNA (cytosine-5)-methyltransferase 1 [Methylobacterium sp. RAS18]